jgi:hypothetical protein
LVEDEVLGLLLHGDPEEVVERAQVLHHDLTLKVVIVRRRSAVLHVMSTMSST